VAPISTNLILSFVAEHVLGMPRSRVHGLASHFVWCNRSKESLTLDVKLRSGERCLERCWKTPTCWCKIWRPAPRRAWVCRTSAA
jgi:hypothetical protein